MENNQNIVTSEDEKEYQQVLKPSVFTVDHHKFTHLQHQLWMNTKSKSRLVITLRDSKDSKVSKTEIQTRTGQKWSTRTAVDQVESIQYRGRVEISQHV